MDLFVLLAASAVAPILVHELGHWLAARRAGVPLAWSFGWGRLALGRIAIPVPRGLWSAPLPEGDERLRRIRRAGFRVELPFAALALVAGILWGGVPPLVAGGSAAVVAVLHRVLYPLYAGDRSDLA